MSTIDAERAEGFRDLCFELLEHLTNGGPATAADIQEYQDRIATLDSIERDPDPTIEVSRESLLRPGRGPTP
jgi:hypothetical protein